MTPPLHLFDGRNFFLRERLSTFGYRVERTAPGKSWHLNDKFSLSGRKEGGECVRVSERVLLPRQTEGLHPVQFIRNTL